MRRLLNALLMGSAVALLLMVPAATGRAQRGQPAGLGDGPFTYGTGNARYRAVVVTKGLVKPWSMAFLPDGSMLITELGGRLRILRKGVLDPKPVPGVPEVYAVRLDGLLDIALHPKFAENRIVYLAYSKVGPNLAPGAETLAARLGNPVARGATGKTTTNALWRARWDGNALVEGQDIFVVITGWTTAFPRPPRRASCSAATACCTWVLALRTLRRLRGNTRTPGAVGRRTPTITAENRALERRRDGAEGQPIRGSGRLQGGDLQPGAPAAARPGRPSGHGRDLGTREWTGGRRRDQHPQGRVELRLAARRLWDATTRVTASGESARLARRAGATRAA